jgi:hydrogenase assembly chaperone HypC/HupF
MCLTIPKKVIESRGGIIKVIQLRSKKEEKVGAIIAVKKGDWVLTQNGIIINKITSKQAKEINKLLNNE